ncbi:hypothetical protein I552_6944 [Mycobacterium xenopi 3993]|nr:hypothetical protein I552_6944 [Mycobacterium xenopi 3993]
MLRGALAGAVGTLAMDLLWYRRYRRQGGDSGFAAWETSAGLATWEDAPAPAQVGKRLFEGVFDRDLAPTRARLVNNVVHWAIGSGWGALFGLVSASVSRRPFGRDRLSVRGFGCNPTPSWCRRNCTSRYGNTTSRHWGRTSART